MMTEPSNTNLTFLGNEEKNYEHRHRKIEQHSCYKEYNK